MLEDCINYWSHFHSGSLCEHCWLIRLSSGQWRKLLEPKPDIWLSIAKIKATGSKSTLAVLRLIERLDKPPSQEE